MKERKKKKQGSVFVVDGDGGYRQGREKEKKN